MKVTLLLSATSLVVGASLAHGQFIFSDFDVTNIWSDAAATSTIVDSDTSDPDLELRVVGTGGFQNALTTGTIARDDPFLENFNLFTELAWDYSSLAADHPTANFINNFLIINTNVNGFGFNNVFNGGFVGSSAGNFSGTVVYDFANDPDDDVLSAVHDYIAGEGTFFQLFLVQQSNGGATNVVSYDDFRFQTEVPEPSTYAAIFGGLALGLAVLRRRLRK
ncbi:MAG: PEP-CTERM sorting domain-containing protein [Opitutales bacterium]